MAIGGQWPYIINYFPRGRDALKWWWWHNEEPPIWFPSYICPELTDEFPNARFYPVKEDLTPDARYIKDHFLSDQNEVIVIVHYFGRPASMEPFEDRNCFIIEDFTHGLLGFLDDTYENPIGVRGHVSFASLGKVTPFSGGMLVRQPLAAKRYLKGMYWIPMLHRERRARMANWLFLEEWIPRENKVIHSMPEPSCPVAYPIQVDRRDDLQKKLIDKRVYCPIHWKLPKQVLLGGFEESVRLSERILSIPLDGRYTSEDLSAVAEVILSHEAE